MGNESEAPGDSDGAGCVACATAGTNVRSERIVQNGKERLPTLASDHRVLASRWFKNEGPTMLAKKTCAQAAQAMANRWIGSAALTPRLRLRRGRTIRCPQFSNSARPRTTGR